MRTKIIAETGVAAALYVILTAALAPISFGAIQCRISDVLLFFSAQKKNVIIGCVLGCAISNIASPLGIIDVVVGAGANLAAGLIIYKLKGNIASVITASLAIGIIVGAEISIMYSIPAVVAMVTTTIGEIVALAIGKFIYSIAIKSVKKNNALAGKSKSDWK